MQTTALPYPRRKLLRVLGVTFGLAVTIGNTIGAGILRTPGEIAAQVPNAWVFLGVWLLGGLYALLGAFSVAELGVTLPRSGGQYVFAREVLGDYAGFIVGWSDWLSTCGTASAVSIVIGEYSGELVHALSGKTLTVAVVVVIFFALVQWRSTRWGGTVQTITSLLKTLAFLVLIGACFWFGGKTSTATLPVPSVMARPAWWVGMVLALQAVIYTYDGWSGVVYFSEEVHEPERNIPRAMFGSIVSIITIYLLVNLALLYALPFTYFPGNKLVAGTVAQLMFGMRGDTIIRVLIILSLLASINAYHLMATRVVFAMSRDGLFSKNLQRVNEGGTPTVALAFSTAVAVLFLLSGTFEKVIAVLAFFFVANYTISFISVFVLRWREPDRPRPYRAWGYPWTTGLALIGSVTFLLGAVASDTQNSVYALVLLALSYPAFRLLKFFNQDKEKG